MVATAKVGRTGSYMHRPRCDTRGRNRAGAERAVAADVPVKRNDIAGPGGRDPVITLSAGTSRYVADCAGARGFAPAGDRWRDPGRHDNRGPPRVQTGLFARAEPQGFCHLVP